ncbi:MAG: PH domain-containing protein [bacterium]|nr:PH domain-containing protein [bacterium]
MNGSDEESVISNTQPVAGESQATETSQFENITDCDYQYLSPRYVSFDRRTSYVSACVIGVLLVAASSPVIVYCLATQRPWLSILVVVGWLIVGLLLGAAAHAWPPIKYRHTTWRLNSLGMEIRRGVYWRHRISVPVARVQHVDVSQGPIQRMFDLGTLTIHTAGTKNSAVELEGLHHEVALQVRDRLISQKESLDVT